MLKAGETALWKDPSGRVRRVRAVSQQSPRTWVIEYFDNDARGETWRHGRRYSHGTRRRVVVWGRELTPVGGEA